MMERPLRIALIGAGHWATRYALAIAALADVELCWVASRRQALPADAFGQARQCEHWTELPLAQLDAAIIANATKDHFDAAAFCLRGALPVLVEKPLVLSVAEGRILTRLSKRHGTPLLVGFTHLYARPYQRLLRLVGRYGGAQAVVSHGGNIGPYRNDMSSLWDYGAHDAAMAVRLFGRLPVTVKAQRIACGPGQFHDQRGDNYRVRLAFPAGKTACFEVGNAMPEKIRLFKVQCPQSTLVYDDLAVAKLQVIQHGQTSPIALGVHEPPLTRMVRALLNTCRRGHRSHWSGPLGVATTQILARCKS